MLDMHKRRKFLVAVLLLIVFSTPCHGAPLPTASPVTPVAPLNRYLRAVMDWLDEVLFPVGPSELPASPAAGTGDPPKPGPVRKSIPAGFCGGSLDPQGC